MLVDRLASVLLHLFGLLVPVDDQPLLSFLFRSSLNFYSVQCMQVVVVEAILQVEVSSVLARDGLHRRSGQAVLCLFVRDSRRKGSSFLA